MSSESDLKKAWAKEEFRKNWSGNIKPIPKSKCHLCGRTCVKVGKVSVCVGGCVK